MNRSSPFVISKFSNPSGEVVFRVSGWSGGKRVRKNFATRSAAEAERQTLDIQRLQAEAGLHTAVTRLSDEQLQEAEAAFLRLKGQPKSLLFYLDFAIANFREKGPTKPLADAAAEYVAVKTREHARDLLSECQLKNIRNELRTLQKRFPGAVLTQFTPAGLVSYCERGGCSLKSYNNRRGILATFFKFAFRQDWVPANLVEKIPHHRIAHRRGTAATLSAKQSAGLMEYIEKLEGGAYVPFFALCLFAGIRPCVRNGEILKLRPEDIRLDTGVIRIEPEVSKVRMKRHVAIQPNLAVWLRAYPLDQFPLIPRNLRDHRAVIARDRGLTHDIMRHTFISMHVAKFRSMGEAALQAGNSETIIRKHYLDLKTKEESERSEHQLTVAPRAARQGASGARRGGSSRSGRIPKRCVRCSRPTS